MFHQLFSAYSKQIAAKTDISTFAFLLRYGSSKPDKHLRKYVAKDMRRHNPRARLGVF
ncbi:MAG: hypothetical protein IJ171_06940 [Ruminococcus sp.]|nr:hypothetical protein [Ruminococcus sp.]